MNRFRSGLVPLFALLALVGCNSEPTGDLRDGPTELIASPTQLFIELGGVKNVEIGSVDAQGNPIDLNYEVTATGPGITVRRDSSFLPIFVNDSTLQAPAVGPRFRFIVEGTGYAASSFTVSAGGLEIVVPVQVVPQTGLAATFDKASYELGDTITLTAPAGVTFADTANLVIPGNPLIPLIVSQDATTIRFIAPPSVSSPIIVNGVISASAPTIVFAPATQTPLVTPLIDTVDVTYSTVTPALAQTVTLTVPEPLIRLAVDSIFFPGQLPGREADPQNIVIAVDSSSLTFDTPPNVDGPGTVVNFLFPGGYLIALPTRPAITSPNIGTELNATFSNQTPAAVQAVTLTAPAGFSFDISLDTTVSDDLVDTTITSPLVITIGGNPAIINSIAGDGSSVDLVPIPGSAGVASVDGVVPDATPDNIVTMNTVQTVTVPPVVGLEGTEDTTTAPDFTVPTVGNTVTLNDAGAFDGDFFGFHTRWYTLEITAPTTLTFTVDWFQGQDLGLYFTQDGVNIIDAADSFGEGPAGHPETVTIAFVPGTYYAGLLNFSTANPSFFQIAISNP